MLKEIFALLLITLLVLVSAWNIRAVDRLCTDIEALLDNAESKALSGEIEAAESHFHAALDKWLGAESYTHIFIRHPEIDSCSDAFYEALEALNSGDRASIVPCLDKLRYHLESIASMERVSLGNVF